MLSRHFLRMKVLQEVYAYYCNEKASVLSAEDSLRHNVARLNDLGNTQIGMMLEFVSVGERMLEEGTQKFIATETDKNPDRRIAKNEFVRRIADNYDYRKQSESIKTLWEDEQPKFRKAFAAFKESEPYRKYLDSSEGYAADKELAIALFRFLMNDEGLRSTIVERSLLWEDDFDQVAQYEFMMLKTLEETTFNEASIWPKVYDERSEGEKEAMDFAVMLLRQTLKNADESNELIRTHLKGWDFERVAQMDIYLLDMAIAELRFCPSIPIRVTVDEYIELSKEFSTDRSKLFINGLLDKLILELRSEGKIEKTGRGLLGIDEKDEEV